MSSDQVRDLIDGDVDAMDVSEQRRRVKDLVQFERFVPTETSPNPCTTTHGYTNPGIDLYCDHLSWGEHGWEPVDETDVLQQNVPEYMPTDAAVETLCEYGPILEIGAGAGYWAHVLSEAGCEILATDYLPPNIVHDDLPDEYWDAVGTEKYHFISLQREERESYQRMWHTVQVADHSCVKSYPSHTILMCHPPAFDWTEEVLDYCHLGQQVAFVGEWFPGPDATPMFFKRLAEEWELVETFPVYDWASMHVGGYVFEKKACR